MSIYEYPIDALSTQDSWRMFRIIAEIVEGFEALGHIRQCVSIFGSARISRESPIYKEAEEIARLLAEAGYGIITGGGPGIMEAGNKGAVAGKGPSIGLHIHLPHEQICNEYVKIRCGFRYFFVRKLMFIKYAMAYVVMPGGMGTIDELSEAFVLAQTHRIKPFPIILYGSGYWQGFVEWLRARMVGEGYINDEELDLLAVKDSPHDVVEHIRRHVIV